MHPRMKKQNSELSRCISAIMNLKYPDFIGYIKKCKVYIVKNYLLSDRQLKIIY
jgi:hypothetical protein